MTTTSTAVNSSSDFDTLVRLNQDYIDAVTSSDRRRFEEILAEDFLCTLPDGSLRQFDKPVGAALSRCATFFLSPTRAPSHRWKAKRGWR